LYLHTKTYNIILCFLFLTWFHCHYFV
jgi:hypothetical protein